MDDYDRSDLLLGVTSWIKDNLSTIVSRKPDILLIDFDSLVNQDSESFKHFRQYVGDQTVSTNQLKQRGRNAKKAGVSKSTLLQEVEYGRGHRVQVLPPLSSDWALFENTFATNRGTRAQRCAGIVKWDTNSCAVDTLIFHALTFGLVLQRRDEASMCTWKDMTLPQMVLRLIMDTPWGSLPMHARSQLRGMLIAALHEEPDVRYDSRYYNDVNECYAACFSGLGCLTYTVSRVYLCCGQNRIRRPCEGIRKRTEHCMQLVKKDLNGREEVMEDGSVADIFNRTFFPNRAGSDVWVNPYGDPFPPLAKCSLDDTCNQLPDEEIDLLDDFGALLMVNIDNGDRVHRNKERKYLDDIYIKCHSRATGMYRTARYSVIGLTIYQDAHSHFVGRSYDPSSAGVQKRVIEFDGIRGDKPYRVKGFLGGLHCEDKIMTIFYQQASVAEVVDLTKA